MFAFGNTEESLRASIFGVPGGGRKADGPLNRKTGRGWVKRGKPGKYADALSKGARVIPFIVESTGAIAPSSLRYAKYLSRRARGKQARDGTSYGLARTSVRSFFPHHTQRLSMAAACGDSRGIFDTLRGLRQGAVAASGSGGGHMAAV